MDLVATEKTVTEQYVEYKTGLACAVPEGWVALIFPRSSVSNYDMILANCVGVVDSGYTGEITARFKRTTNGIWTKEYEPGDRICQMVLVQCGLFTPEEVDELPTTARGVGGYGSTNK